MISRHKSTTKLASWGDHRPFLCGCARETTLPAASKLQYHPGGWGGRNGIGGVAVLLKNRHVIVTSSKANEEMTHIFHLDSEKKNFFFFNPKGTKSSRTCRPFPSLLSFWFNAMMWTTVAAVVVWMMPGIFWSTMAFPRTQILFLWWFAIDCKMRWRYVKITFQRLANDRNRSETFTRRALRRRTTTWVMLDLAIEGTKRLLNLQQNL